MPITQQKQRRAIEFSFITFDSIALKITEPNIHYPCYFNLPRTILPVRVALPGISTLFCFGAGDEKFLRFYPRHKAFAAGKLIVCWTRRIPNVSFDNRYFNLFPESLLINSVRSSTLFVYLYTKFNPSATYDHG